MASTRTGAFSVFSGLTTAASVAQAQAQALTPRESSTPSASPVRRLTPTTSTEFDTLAALAEVPLAEVLLALAPTSAPLAPPAAQGPLTQPATATADATAVLDRTALRQAVRRRFSHVDDEILTATGGAGSGAEAPTPSTMLDGTQPPVAMGLSAALSYLDSSQSGSKEQRLLWGGRVPEIPASVLDEVAETRRDTFTFNARVLLALVFPVMVIVASNLHGRMDATALAAGDSISSLGLRPIDALAVLPTALLVVVWQAQILFQRRELLPILPRHMTALLCPRAERTNLVAWLLQPGYQIYSLFVSLLLVNVLLLLVPSTVVACQLAVPATQNSTSGSGSNATGSSTGLPPNACLTAPFQIATYFSDADCQPAVDVVMFMTNTAFYSVIGALVLYLAVIAVYPARAARGVVAAGLRELSRQHPVGKAMVVDAETWAQERLVEYVRDQRTWANRFKRASVLVVSLGAFFAMLAVSINVKISEKAALYPDLPAADLAEPLFWISTVVASLTTLLALAPLTDLIIYVVTSSISHFLSPQVIKFSAFIHPRIRFGLVGPGYARGRNEGAGQSGNGGDGGGSDDDDDGDAESLDGRRRPDFLPHTSEEDGRRASGADLGMDGGDSSSTILGLPLTPLGPDATPSSVPGTPKGAAMDTMRAGLLRRASSFGVVSAPGPARRRGRSTATMHSPAAAAASSSSSSSTAMAAATAAGATATVPLPTAHMAADRLYVSVAGHPTPCPVGTEADAIAVLKSGQKYILDWVAGRRYQQQTVLHYTLVPLAVLIFMTFLAGVILFLVVLITFLIPSQFQLSSLLTPPAVLTLYTGIYAVASSVLVAIYTVGLVDKTKIQVRTERERWRGWAGIEVGPGAGRVGPSPQVG